MTMRHRVAVAAVAAVVGVAAIVVILIIVGLDQGIGDGGAATSATVTPLDVAVDSAGNLYIADLGRRIRKVTPDGDISTIVAGDCTDDGMINISHVAVDGEGNAFFPSGELLCRMAVDGTITVVAGKPNPSKRFGMPMSPCQGIETGNLRGRATDIEVCPDAVVLDAVGNAYFVDESNFGHRLVRMVTEAGDMSTLELGGSRPSCIDGVGATAVPDPTALAMDEEGNLFVVDYAGCQVLKVDADGTITVVAGSGMWGSSGDGGLAVDAAIVPRALAIDTEGNVYIVDDLGHLVRKVSPDGIISKVAGNGSLAFSGDGGQALAAAMYPRGIAVDRAGNLYIADYANRVLKVSPDGIVSTVAGDGSVQEPPCGDSC